MSDSASASVELEQPVAAPRHVVWRACASADGMARWQADRVEGEAKIGGHLKLTWPAFGARIDLEVTDLVPYEKITLSSGESVVEFTITDRGVRVQHVGIEAERDAEGLASSWGIALAQLAHSVEKHPERQRSVRWALRSVTTSPQMAHLFFTEPSCLDQWLTDSARIGAEGEPFELMLKSGIGLSGRVLKRVEGRDLALAVNSHNQSVLTLRTLPSPLREEQRLVALVWSQWGPPKSETDDLVEQFNRATHALERVLALGGAA